MTLDTGLDSALPTPTAVAVAVAATTKIDFHPSK